MSEFRSIELIDDNGEGYTCEYSGGELVCIITNDRWYLRYLITDKAEVDWVVEEATSPARIKTPPNIRRQIDTWISNKAFW